MSLANCSRCGKVFSFVPGGKDICPACLKEEDDNYLKIFHYLSTRPSATAQEIAQATEIDVKEIYRYVRENRLRLVQTDMGLRCESCGIPISQGKICENCRNQLSDEIKSDLQKFRQTNLKDPASREEPRDPKHLKDRRGKRK
jgi:flagellar operon protein (TIGR03826 family)